MKLLRFNNEMMQAVLAGEKTQTRRPIKPQPDIPEQELHNLGTWANGLTLSERVNAAWQAGFIGVPWTATPERQCETGDLFVFG